MKTESLRVARDAAARPRRVHPRPAPQRAAVAAQAERARRHLEPVSQPDRARAAQAVGRDPPGDRARAAHLGRDALRPGRDPRRAHEATAAPISSPRSSRDPTLTERQKQVLVEIYRSFQQDDRTTPATPRPADRLGRSARAPGQSPAHVWRDDPPPMSVRRDRRVLMHTSPLAQPGAGDGGGMNVYVRALASALGARRRRVRRLHPRRAPRAARGRRGRARLPRPARRGRAAGAGAEHELPELVDPFVDATSSACSSANPVDVLHGNYWLSGAVAHQLKHLLDLPLVATFHTLARVKADAGIDDDPEHRTRVEHEVDRVRRPDARVDRRRTRRSSRRSTTRIPSASRSCRPASTTRCSSRRPRRGAGTGSASTRRACCCSSVASSR